MKKLKERAAARAAAGIVLAIALFVAVLTGFVTVTIVIDGGYSDGLADDLRRDYIDSEMMEAANDISLYYEAYISSDEYTGEHTLSYYEDKFSESNSNLYFSVIPNDTFNYPELVNYAEESSQYYTEIYSNTQYYGDFSYITYYIPLTQIIEAWKEEVETGDYTAYSEELGIIEFKMDEVNTQTSVSIMSSADGSAAIFYAGRDEEEEYSEDEYGEEATGTTETVEYGEEATGTTETVDESSDTIQEYDTTEATTVDSDGYMGFDYMMAVAELYGSLDNISYENLTVNTSDYNNYPYISLDGTAFIYSLASDPEFVNLLEQSGGQTDAGYVSYSMVAVDCTTGRVDFTVQPYEDVYYTIKLNLRKNLTADDAFSRSFIIRDSAQIIRLSPILFGISVVLILISGGFLIAAAGHREGGAVVCGLFDRIPYDVIWMFAAAGVFLFLLLMNDYLPYNISDIVYVGSYLLLIAAVTGIFVPPLLSTTAVRLKTDGFRMFANTVIFRTGKLVWRAFTGFFRACGKLLDRIGRYFNLYWKCIGVFLIIEVIKVVFFVAGTTSFSILIEFAFACVASAGLIILIVQFYRLKNGAEKIAGGQPDYQIDTAHMPREFASHGKTLNTISDSIQTAVEERMKSERMKTELITNVSHDIKTPLTSIISYVDLLSKEEHLNEKQTEYLEVLNRQSIRLKKLIEDLIEASKASTGNLEVHMEPTNVETLLEQALGEFSGKLEERKLSVIVTNHLMQKYGEQADNVVMADGRHLWRVFDNLIGNIVKYAQPGSRVYVDLDEKNGSADTQTLDVAVREGRKNKICLTFKNISKDALNISGDELVERFVRGDRSRNTDGNGLGLSIAKSLVELQNGHLKIVIDGDLFKVLIFLNPS